MSARRDRIELFTAASFTHVDQRPVWHWSYIAGNGRILADGGQGYSRRIDAWNGACRVTGVSLRPSPNCTQEVNGQERLVWEVTR